jgi:hypothetical protein
MWTFNDILMIISSIGVINSVFVVLYLFTSQRGNKQLNILLSLLIAGFSIRIGKSVVFYFSDQLHTVVINIGFGFFNMGSLFSAFSTPPWFVY